MTNKGKAEGSNTSCDMTGLTEDDISNLSH